MGALGATVFYYTGFPAAVPHLLGVGVVTRDNLFWFPNGLLFGNHIVNASTQIYKRCVV